MTSLPWKKEAIKRLRKRKAKQALLQRQPMAYSPKEGVPPIVPLKRAGGCEHTMELVPTGRDRFEAKCYKCGSTFPITGCTLKDGTITIMTG